MDRRIRLEEATALYSSLSADERDELLECLLTAACRGGGKAMMRVLDELVLCRAAEEILRDQEGET